MTDLATPAGAPQLLDVSGTPRTPFGRLVKVEWRKLVDTRGGFWLLAITGILLFLTMAIVTLVVSLEDVAITAGALSQIFTIPVSLLLPVFAVLSVTSEWSQRTALTSFTLEPHRPRVVLAKFVAVSVLAVAAIAVAVGFGALTNVLCAAITGNDLVWNLKASLLFWTVVSQLLYFWMAFGFGMAFLNTPGAISVYYIVALLLPFMVWGTLYALFDWARDVIPWFDLGFAMTPLTSGVDPMTGLPVEVDALVYAQTAFTAFLWVALPVSVGLSRILRAEVK